MDVIVDYLILFGINLAIIVALITGLYWRGKPNRNYAIATTLTILEFGHFMRH